MITRVVNGEALRFKNETDYSAYINRKGKEALQGVSFKSPFDQPVQKDLFKPEPTKVLKLSFERDKLFNPIVKPSEEGNDTKGLINVPILYGDMGNRYLMRGFVKLSEPRVVTPDKLEKTVLYVLLRTKYNESLSATYGRYLFDFNGCSNIFLKHILNTLLECDLKRINLSWVGPLQTLLLQRQIDKVKELGRKHKKSKKKASQEDEGLYIQKPRLASAQAPTPKSVKQVIAGNYQRMGSTEFHKSYNITKDEFAQLYEGREPDRARYISADSYLSAVRYYEMMCKEGSIRPKIGKIIAEKRVAGVNGTVPPPSAWGLEDQEVEKRRRENTPYPEDSGEIKRLDLQPPEYWKAVADKQQEDEWLSPKETEIKRPSTSTKSRRESETLKPIGQELVIDLETVARNSAKVEERMKDYFIMEGGQLTPY